MVGKASMWKFAWRSVKKLSKLDFTDFYYCAEQKIVSLVTSLFENPARSAMKLMETLNTSNNIAHCPASKSAEMSVHKSTETVSLYQSLWLKPINEIEPN